MRPLLIGLLSAVLAACAAVPSRPAPDLRDEARALASRNLGDPGLGAAEARFGLSGAAAAPWTPDRIVVAAWYFDPVLAQARASAVRASADAALAVQRVNPAVSLSPEKVFSGLTSPSPWTIGVALLLPLLHPGEAAARRALAVADTEAARDQLAQAVWDSRTRAVTDLRDMLLARRAQESAQTVAQDRIAYLEGVRQRVVAGASSRDVQLAAELGAAQANADVANRRARRVAAERALAVSIGVPWSALAYTSLDWPELETPPAPSTLPSATLAAVAARNRVDLAELLARYRATEARLQAAAGARYPAAQVAPGYIYDQGQRKFSFGVNLELPLFHGAGARIRAAAAARDEAAAAVLARQAATLGALDAARADYTERYAAWQRMTDAAAAARAAADRAGTQRAAGQIDRGGELSAKIVAANGRLAAEDALAAALGALGKLEDALQRPLWPSSQLPPPTVSHPPPSSPTTGATHAPLY